MALTKVNSNVLDVSEISIALANDSVNNGIKDYVDSRPSSATTTAVDVIAGNSSTLIANTRFVTTALTSKANINGPTTFTGVIRVPTPTAGDNSTTIATTEFVVDAIVAKAPKANPAFTGVMVLPSGAGTCEIKAGTGDGASATTYNLTIRSWYGIGFRDYTDSATVKAYINCRTGAIYGQTAAANTNTTQLATTEFVMTEVSDKANITSPSFLGTPSAITPWGTNNTRLATTEFVNSAVSTNAIPIGGVMYVAQSTAYPGFIDASGQAISRTTYAALYAVVGTRYGAGNGSTTFNLPDLRGEFIRGWDNGRGVDASRVLGSAQSDLYENHTHAFSLPDSGGTGSGDAYATIYASAGNYGRTTSASTTGGTETRPRNIAMIAVIKY